MMAALISLYLCVGVFVADWFRPPFDRRPGFVIAIDLLTLAVFWFPILLYGFFSGARRG